MKKLLKLLCLSLLLMTLTGCGEEASDISVSNGQAGVEASKQESTSVGAETTKEPTEATPAPTEKPSLLPEGTYEANLPNDIILEYDGKSISVVNTTGAAIVEELGIEPTDVWNYIDPDDYDRYTNGLPQNYAYEYYGTQYLELNDKYFNDDYSDIRLQQVYINYQNQEDIPEIKVFGFGKDTTYEDVYKVFGNPTSIGGDEKGYDLCELQWFDGLYLNENIKIKMYVLFEEQQYRGINLDFLYK